MNNQLFEKKIRETIKQYKLIQKKDKVIVALSGGKDSATVLYLLKKFGYNVSALMIDLHLGKWSEIHKENMIRFCKDLEVKLNIVDLKKEFGHGICFIKSIVKKQKNLSGCSVCGVIKRWILNKWARKLKADKIATGHNLDDECQTILMNFLKGNLYLGANSTPATGIESNIGENSINPKKKFCQRIKPLFFMPESEIRKYAKENNFPILYERCPCAIGTYRVETREWLNFLGDKEKLKIVKNFQKIIPKLRKERTGEPKECCVCGEPSKGDVCNACRIFECFKGM